MRARAPQRDAVIAPCAAVSGVELVDGKLGGAEAVAARRVGGGVDGDQGKAAVDGKGVVDGRWVGRVGVDGADGDAAGAVCEDVEHALGASGVDEWEDGDEGKLHGGNGMTIGVVGREEIVMATRVDDMNAQVLYLLLVYEHVRVHGKHLVLCNGGDRLVVAPVPRLPPQNICEVVSAPFPPPCTTTALKAKVFFWLQNGETSSTTGNAMRLRSFTIP